MGKWVDGIPLWPALQLRIWPNAARIWQMY